MLTNESLLPLDYARRSYMHSRTLILHDILFVNLEMKKIILEACSLEAYRARALKF